MSGSTPTNNTAVQYQMSQDQQAQQKEADRQARLQQGKDMIDKIFNGQAVMGTKSTPFDWSTFNANNVGGQSRFRIDPTTGAASFNDPTNASQYGLPTGYKVILTAPKGSGTASGGGSGGATSTIAPVAGASTGAGTLNPTPRGDVVTGGSAGAGTGTWAGGRGSQPQVGAPSYQGGRGAVPLQPNERGILTDVMSGNSTGGNNPYGGATTAGGNGSVYAIQGPDGKIYYQGDALNIDQSYDTGQKTGGFDDDFYNQYKQKYLDYYNPQEARQYDTSKRDLLYSLANQGSTTSSVAADKYGDLAYNDALAKGKIVSDANTATGALRDQIQSNKSALLNQLYATEDPTMTADLAQSSANSSRLQDPTGTPLAALFTPAMTAVGAAAQNYLSPSSTYGGQNTTQTATPRAANAGSGSYKA